MADLYSTLGVAKTASRDEIRKAFRDKAKTHHPDKGGDAEAFKKLEEAHRILTDPDARAFYNATGEMPDQSDAHNPKAFLYQVVAQCLAESIAEMENPAASDLIAVMRRTLAKGKQGVEAKRREMDEVSQRLAIVHARIKSKGEQNVLRALVQGQIDGVKAQLETMANAEKTIDEALAWLKDYSYECDKVLPRPQPYRQQSGILFEQNHNDLQEAMKRFNFQFRGR